MKNKISVFLAAPIIVLLLLLLRENEAKIAAETKLKNVQFKTTSVLNEKGNAINELETQLTELQVKLHETEENDQKALAAKTEEMEKLSADFEIKTRQRDEEIQQKNKNIDDLENEIKQNSDRYNAALKKKNVEISGLGEELRKTTERLAASLKKQEAIESENFNLQQKMVELTKQIQKLQSEQTRLEGLLKASQDKPASLD